MTSVKAQMQLHEASRVATAALEASSRAAINKIFNEWDVGIHTAQSVRHQLENTIRSAYRTSAGVARGVAQTASEIDGWNPDEVFNNDYLQALLSDVRKNLRDYKSGDLSRVQAISRISHSAGVAAQRGYTDQIISAYTELEGFGMKVMKYWVANFVNNTPCPSCTALHGTSVGLNDSFTDNHTTGIYRDLQGPPRHPNCQCRLFMFTQTLDTAFQSPNFDKPQDAPTLVHSSDVKNMSKGIFASILAGLKAILKFLRRK